MLLILSIIISVFFLIPTVQATSPNVVLNEIQVAGAAADDEFIELFNPTDAPVPVGTWSLQYKSASGSSFNKKNFPSDATVPAHGYFLIAHSGYGGAPSADMTQSTISLAGSGGNVFLVASQTLLASSTDPTVIDRVGYGTATDGEGTATPAPPAGQSISRTNGIDSDNNAADFTIGNSSPTNQTSGGATPPPSPTPPPPTPPPASPPPPPSTVGGSVPILMDPIRVVINEFMPAPTTGEDEWIELYNTSSYAVELTGWTLADGTGKSVAALSGLLQPSGFKTVELRSARLNNSGDLVILRDDQKREVDAVTYGEWEQNESAAPNADDGQSVARITDGMDTNRDHSDFAVTITPTPGMSNKITAPTPQQESTAAPSEQKSTRAVTRSSPTSGDRDYRWIVELLKEQTELIGKALTAENVIVIEKIEVHVNNDSAPLRSARTPKSDATGSAPTATKKSAKKKTAAISKKTSGKTKSTTVQGMAIVLPSQIWKDYLVVRMETESVQVRVPKNSKHTFASGDLVSANGSWSKAKDLPLPRLLTKSDSSIKITGHTDPPQPTKIDLATIAHHVGELVEVQGPIVERQTARVRIATDDHSVVIPVEKTINTFIGDTATARGLLTKQNEEYKLYPIGTGAVVVTPKIVKKEPSRFSRMFLPYAIALAPAGILTSAVLIGKRKKKKGGDEDGR